MGLKLFFAVTKTREDSKFQSSFLALIESCRSKYEIEVGLVWNTVLCDAQNTLANAFLLGDADYMILFDDDQSGHTIEMVDCLINANAYMATMKTYGRHFPYYSALMKRVMVNGNARYVGIERDTGYVECDLTGFPMTALRRDLFDIIEYPYFRQMPDSGGRKWATDEEFCLRLEKHGIKPMGCNQFVLAHGDITEENVQERRIKDMPNYSGILNWVKRQRLINLKTNSNSPEAKES